MKNLMIALPFTLMPFLVNADDLGKKTYEIACKNCHAPNLAKAIKAPAAFDKEAWDTRFKNAQLESDKNLSKYPSAIAYLLNSITLGKGLMHHGGLCHESDRQDKDCSDKAFIAAIGYMSQKDVNASKAE